MKLLPQIRLLLLATGTVLTLGSCFDFTKKPARNIYPEAYVPVYGIDSAHRIIAAEQPRATEDAGKIYTLGNRLYQVETFKGIHVIDYSDINDPKKLAFISIPGCSEVAAKGNILLTNNMTDLVSVDISDLQHVKLVSRTSGAFSIINFYNMDAAMAQPSQRGVHYVCPNTYSGDVIGWKLEKNVTDAFCTTN